MRHLKLAISVATLVAAMGAAAGVSAQDVITQRQDIMKSFGAQGRDSGGMVRGTTPYDAAKAAQIVDVYAKGAAALPALFPATSQTGKTDALPAIWTNRADFDAKLASFTADVNAAKSAVADETTGKAALAQISKNCGGCHPPYRKPPATPPGGAPGAAPGGMPGMPGMPGMAKPPG